MVDIFMLGRNQKLYRLSGSYAWKVSGASRTEDRTKHPKENGQTQQWQRRCPISSSTHCTSVLKYNGRDLEAKDNRCPPDNHEGYCEFC